MSYGLDRIGRMRVKYDLGPERRVGLLGFACKASKAGDPKNPRDIVVTANTDDVDLDKEVVVPAGADVASYRENRANFLDHRYDFPHHVGFLRSIHLREDGRAWVNRSQIFDRLKSPLADDLLEVARTIGIGSSIGFEELEGSPPHDDDLPHYRAAEYVVRKWRMIELSFTAMPANVSCRGLAERPGGDADKALAGLDALVTKSRIKLATAVALGLPRRPVVPVAGTAAGKRRMLRVFAA